MSAKIKFIKLETPLNNIKINFGQGYISHPVDEIRVNGVEIPSSCEDFDDITILGQKTEVKNIPYKINENSVFDNRASTVIINDANFTFYENENHIKKVVFSDTITAIPDNVCRGCQNLTTVIIPNTITSIGEYVFADCPLLTEITLPDTLESIITLSFIDSSIKTVHFKGTSQKFIEIGGLEAFADLNIDGVICSDTTISPVGE